MGVAIITGSGGLIGSEAALHFAGLGLTVVGIDNDMRKTFFGPDGSTAWNVERLTSQLGAKYIHHGTDIRDREGINRIFERFAGDINIVIHAAAQPSHDWAARAPMIDFEINAMGTMNLLEAARASCATVPFVFTSTNKVYGDTPNSLPLVELDRRFDLPEDHPYFGGVKEDMVIDQSLHSVFGASKVAADVMVQEYGRYFDMPTVCFRGGTLTGPNHSAAELHGFLAYLMRCTMSGTKYTVYGYKGKQVRDAIHSRDLVHAFECVMRRPIPAAVYNIGGGRQSNCSVLEAIDMCETIVDRPLDWVYSDINRVGDHLWWIGDNGRFEQDYPEWKQRETVNTILQEMFELNQTRWTY
jgi:CDP-paratose 2-epimerase